MTEELEKTHGGGTATEEEQVGNPGDAVEEGRTDGNEVQESKAGELDSSNGVATEEESEAVETGGAERAPRERSRDGASWSGGERRGYYSDRDGSQSFDQMMKAFRKQSVDIQRKLKKSRFYEKPSVKRRKQRQEAIKKARKNRRYN